MTKKDNPGVLSSTGDAKRGGVDDMKVEQILEKERNKDKKTGENQE